MEVFNVHKQNTLFDLIKQGAYMPALEILKGDHNFSEDELNKSLVLACACGQNHLVEMLIGCGADINCRDTNGNTPLMISVLNCFTDIVKFLLRNKADINISNSVGDSALILSAGLSGSRKITQHLLKQTGINIDHQNKDGYTAIMKAAEVKNVDALKILLDEYFKVDSSKNTSSCCELTEGHKTYQHVSDSVPKNGFKWTTLVQTFNCKGENLYQIAKRCGLGNVFLLLQEHVNTNISPLKLALRGSDMKSFLVFLDCDFINATSKKKYLDKAWEHIFQTCSNKDIIDFTENEIDTIKALLRHGADVNTTWCSKTPMVNKEFSENIRVTKLFARFNPPHKPLYCLNQINPIHIAAKSGCLKVLELLLSFKADVNRNSFLDSPLHVALSHDHTECAKLLIQHGADVSYIQAFKLAVGHQETEYVRFLTESYKHEIMRHLRKKEINKILIRSVRKGSLEIIGVILDLGANINCIVSGDPDTCPLVESKNGEVAQFLIDKGANVKHVKHIRHKLCISPLIEVINNRDRKDNSVLEVIEVLLENGASGNDENGMTPLMYAAALKRNTHVLQLLLNHGAELSEVDNNGNTAFVHAVWKGCFQNISFIYQAIKDRKKLLNLQSGGGLTPLMYATMFRNTAIIEQLIEQGADVNIKDSKGNTALLHLVEKAEFHKHAALKSLIQAGCDVNWQNNKGLSPLMVAAENNFLKDTLHVLLDSGADINAVSKMDTTKTALSHLLFKVYNDDKHFSCLEYLLCRGASVSDLDASVFDKLIIAGRTRIVLKLIQCGLGPVNYRRNDKHFINLSPGVYYTLFPSSNDEFYYSALHTALCVGNKDLVRFFVDNLFLTRYDIYFLGCNKLLRQKLERKYDKEYFDILNKISAQPMSLFNLSFVAVTTAVGTAPGRGIRVEKLPVPQIIKDKLLFKDIALTVPETDFRSVYGSQTSQSYDEYSSDTGSYTEYESHTEDDSDRQYYYSNDHSDDSD